MARKKINKKVAFIGLGVISFIAVVAIVILLTMSKDPQKFIEDAKVALENKDFKAAEKAYGIAYNNSESIDQRLKILFDMADMALIEDPGDEEKERKPKEANWRKALGYWKNATIIDTKNLEAREKLLDYFYIIADSGQLAAWDNVKTTSEEMIKIYEEKNEDIPALLLQTYGRSELEIAEAGKTADINETLKNARKYLTLAKEAQPTNIDNYNYLARVELQQGIFDDNTGKINAIENSRQKAMDIINEGIDLNPNSPKIYIDALRLKLSFDSKDIDKIRDLESEYKALLVKFPSNSEVYYALATYYQFDIKNLSKALETIEKAIEIEPDNIDYIKLASNTYYRFSQIFEKPEYMQLAIETVQKALNLPDLQETSGPEQGKNKNNRLIIHSILGKFYIESALATEDENLKEKLIENAESSIHEIEQIIGVGDNRIVLKWKGLLDLAKGNRNEAIVKLYNAYQQFETTGRPDADLSYTLAEIFMNTPYKGATQKFLNSALLGNIVQISKPKAALEFADLLIQFQDSANSIKLIEQYETVFGQDKETLILKIRSYLAGNLYEEASSLINELEADSPERIKYSIQLMFSQMRQLQQIYMTSEDNSEYEEEINQKVKDIAKLLKKQIEIDPESVDQNLLTTFVNNFIATGEINLAKELAELYSNQMPQDITGKILVSKTNIVEPENITNEMLKEITIDAILSIKYEAMRDFSLARYYQSIGETDEAIKILNPYLQDEEVKKDAISFIFDLASAQKNVELAKKMAELAKNLNIDQCNGDFFEARIALAEEDYEKAINKCENCIKMQPIFPSIYTSLSIAYEKLGKLDLAVENAEIAFSQQPLDRDIARQRASVIYTLTQSLGDSASEKQKAQTQSALVWAMKLDPSNYNLQSIYAEYVYEEDPRKALAIRQALQKTAPSIQNAHLLGNMALRIAKAQTNPEVQKAMLDIAEDSYTQALKLQPDNQDVLNSYSEFLRLTGRESEIEELLKGKESILWKAYIRSSKFTKAKEILDGLHEKDPQNIEYVKGLILVAERTLDRDDIEKYTEEMLKIEDSMENRLAQIQAMTDIGMIAETEQKIMDFKSKYPDNTDIQLLEASLFVRKGLLNEALDSINFSLEKDQSNVLALQLRAQVNSLKGNYDEAISDFAKAKSLNDTASIRMDLAKAYARADRIDQAITELKIAIDENKAPMTAQAFLEKLYTDKGDNKKLGEFYDEMISKYPESNYWKNRKANLFARTGKENEALEIYLNNWNQSLEESEVGDGQALQGYLNTLNKTGNYSTLLSFAPEYTDSAFSVVVYKAMGEAKANQSDNEMAIKYFGKALEKSGTSRNLINSVMFDAIKSIGKEGFSKVVDDKLSSNPNDIAAHLTAFIFMANESNFNKALEHIDRCIELSQDEETRNFFKSNKADTLQLAYNKLPKNEYLEESANIYRELLQISPNNVAILNNLAYLLASNNQQLDEALKYAERAYAMAPGNGTILDTYGFVLLQKGEAEKAVQLLLQAVQLFELGAISAPAETYEHLGNANEKLGNTEEAITAYKQALQSTEIAENEAMKKRLEQAVNRLENN